jgi:ATP-binding cassette subfamily F protein 3
MEKVRVRLSSLDTLIADPDFYSDERREERLKALAEHGDLSKQSSQLEDQWLELHEQLEEVSKAE